MEKLSWSDLRKAIAQRIHTDEKEVATFMSALAPAITKALQEDRQVRITGFGTFKLQSISPRKSVNVATGESFTLPGYDKLTFSPEASIKELISNLDSSTEPTQDDATPLRKLGEQANEIVGILSDLGQAPDGKKEEPKEEPEPVIEEQQPAIEEPVIEKPVIEEPVKTTIPMTETSHIEVQTEKKEKKCRPWLIVGITVLAFAGLLALAFLFVGNKFVTWVESLNNKEEQTEVVQPDLVVEAEPVEEEIVEEAPASTLPYPLTYNEFIAKEYLPRGSRLAWLARKYYDNRDLWVFIYEANKDVVEHPSIIDVGTLIRIPKLPAEMMDFSNPELQQLVDRLAEEYKKL